MSQATFVAHRAGDDAGAAWSLRSPYATGAFVPGPGMQPPSTRCGDRGVHFAQLSCGRVAFAACGEESDAGNGMACIYLSPQPFLDAGERRTAAARHFVDGTGRCWELVDALVSVDAGLAAMGATRAGTFEATAVSGAARRRLRGSFVACCTVVDNATCE